MRSSSKPGKVTLAALTPPTRSVPLHPSLKHASAACSLGIASLLAMSTSLHAAVFYDAAGDAGVAETTDAYPVGLADYDNNGYTDILVNRRWNGPFSLYQNFGGVFVEDFRTDFGIKDRTDCGWGDANGDNRPDLYCTVGAFFGTQRKANQLWIQQPDGSFRDEATDWGVADPFGRGRQITWLNYNNDGNLDLFVGNGYPRADGIPSNNKLFVNNGSSFVEQVIPGLTGEIGARCAFSADFGSDSLDDLLVCGKSGLRVYRNTSGTGFVNEASSIGINYYARDALAADLTGDGNPDLIAIRNTGVLVYRWLGNWQFSSPQFIPWNDAVSAATGDIDGDGDLDIYVAAGEKPPNKTDALLRNRGNGFFDAEAIGISATAGVAGRVEPIDHDLDQRDGFWVVNSTWSGDGGPLQLIVEQSDTPPPPPPPPPTPTASVADVRISEEADDATVILSLSSPASGDLSFSFSTTDGSATAGQDYTLSTGTVTVLDGLTQASIVIPLTGDDIDEGSETFTVTLSNPPSGVVLGQDQATVTLLDDDGSVDPACGQPAYNPGTFRGIVVWRDCTATGANPVFEVRTPGGGSSTALKYVGEITSTGPLGVTGVSIEPSDTLDSVPGDNTAEFNLFVIRQGFDGFTLTVQEGANACLDVTDMPTGGSIIVGAEGQTFNAPFDMVSLGACAEPPPPTPTASIGNVSVSEEAGTATLTVTLSAPAPGDVALDYATTDGTATAGQDYSASSDTLTIPDGQREATIDIPLSGDDEEEGTETFTVTLSNPPSGIALGQAQATVRLFDDDSTIDPACGQPAYAPGTDRGIYLWRDCTATGPDAVYEFRMPGGGSTSALRYSGAITATAPLGVNGVSIERSDTLDSVPGDAITDFILFVIRQGFDGFTLTVPEDAEACVDITELPTGASVVVGEGNQVVNGPFDPATLGACAGAPPP